MISRIKSKRVTWCLGRHLLVMLATVLLGALLAATLVRVAPGFDVDEQQLDSRLSSESRDALRSGRVRNSNIVVFYVDYLRRAISGDLGRSQILNRPVRELIAERLPVTTHLVALGLLWGWLIATALGAIAALARVNSVRMFIGGAAGALLCFPSAVLAMAFVVARAPAYLALALVVLPKVFAFTRNLVISSYAMPHVITARAKGIRETRVLLWHVLPVTGGQVIAVFGVSVSMALGAAIPVEALCGLPGIGQLAWQAALGRDLPLLVTLTMIVACVTMTANSISDAMNQILGPATR
ncbi:MAG TPA: ABC transporter permease [Terriglobales bacterium]|nr:ABC transporter permease [Terriglobales bacterium]